MELGVSTRMSCSMKEIPQKIDGNCREEKTANCFSEEKGKPSHLQKNDKKSFPIPCNINGIDSDTNYPIFESGDKEKVLETRKVGSLYDCETIDGHNDDGHGFGQNGVRRKLVLLMVFTTLLVDNMLLTSIVPVVPDILLKQHQVVLVPLKKVILQSSQVFPLATHEHPVLLQSTKSNHQTRHVQTEDNSEPFFKSPNSLAGVISLLSEAYDDASMQAGFLFGSKALVQLISAPSVGGFVERHGSKGILLFGSSVLLTSTLGFAFANGFWLLFLARAFQGLGSSCTSIAGMSLLASCYKDDNERGKAFGIAMGGLAFGALLGPVYGGYFYQYIGRLSPFLILAGIILLNGGLQLIILSGKQHSATTEKKDFSTWLILSDPRVLLTAITICIGNFGIGMLEPNLPLWMHRTMNAGNFEQGMAFLPSSLCYFLSTNIFGWFGNRIGRRSCAAAGLILLAVAFALIPLTNHILLLIPPMAMIGVAVGMVDGTMMPAMGLLVDEHHASAYGVAYAIGDSAFCVGFAFGPFLSGPIINVIGFSGMMWCLSLLTMIVCYRIWHSSNYS